MKRSTKTHINAWLDAALLKQIKRESVVQGITVSAVVRKALFYYVQGGPR